MEMTTLSRHIWPSTGANVLRPVALAAMGVVLVAVAAHVSVPMLPVPMTLQTLAVLAIGAAYGSRLGAATLALYAIAGAAGLPVFSPKADVYPSLFGPTGGYIIGFILTAYVVGWFAERGWDRSVPKMFVAMLIGAAILYIPGLLWLQGFIGWEKSIQGGLLPFLAGDVVKAMVAALGFPAVWTLLGQRQQ